MSAKEDCRHLTLPPLIKAIAANEVDGFDDAKPSAVVSTNKCFILVCVKFNWNLFISELCVNF